MCTIVPSLLEADYCRLADQFAMIERAQAQCVHIDVMDGHFVPNLSFGARMIAGLRGATRLFFDVHLMVDAPEAFLAQMRAAGADAITFHWEACRQPLKMLSAIRTLGAHAGIAINPETDVDALPDALIREADRIQIMSTRPGRTGQSFLPDAIGRVERLKSRIGHADSRALIEVDGGVNFDNAPLLAAAGADVLVSGKALFDGDLIGNIRKMSDLCSAREAK